MRPGWSRIFVTLVAVTAGLAFWATLARPSWAQAIQAALVGATFWAVLFYTLEARALRLQEFDANELQQFPWLLVSDFKAAPQHPGEGVLGGVVFSFKVRDIGMTPAYDVLARIDFVLTGDETHSKSLELGPVGLGPQEDFEITWPAPIDEPGRGELTINLTYRTGVGGSARLVRRFELQGPRLFRIASTDYKWTLSRGAALSRSPVDAQAVGRKV